MKGKLLFIYLLIAAFTTVAIAAEVSDNSPTNPREATAVIERVINYQGS